MRKVLVGVCLCLTVAGVSYAKNVSFFMHNTSGMALYVEYPGKVIHKVLPATYDSVRFDSKYCSTYQDDQGTTHYTFLVQISEKINKDRSLENPTSFTSDVSYHSSWFTKIAGSLNFNTYAYWLCYYDKGSGSMKQAGTSISRTNNFPADNMLFQVELELAGA